MSAIRNLILTTGVAVSASTWAVDRRVPQDFPSIQAALDVALDGDRVVVAPGRYYEVLRFPARAIHMIAPAGPAQTIIDGQAAGTVVTFDGAPGRGAILEGFTLTNGFDLPGGGKAGGVHMGPGASATVRGNIIRQNRGGGSGHGMSLQSPASPLIVGNEIRHNRSSGTGGGGGGGIGVSGSMCAGVPGCGTEIRNNYIGNNYATGYSSGGGIFLNGARVTVVGNVIEYNISFDEGGGLGSANGSRALVENNLFHANLSKRFGGGIYFSICQGCLGPTIINNTFVGNEARDGSAIYLTRFGGPQSRIINNIVSAIGSGAALDCEVSTGSAAPTTRNNVVHAPQGSGFGGLCAPLAGIDGNRLAEPMFAGEFDFRLLPGSPGVDEGEGGQSSEPADLAGKARVADGDGDGDAVIDIGAYELPPPTIFIHGFESTP